MPGVVFIRMSCGPGVLEPDLILVVQRQHISTNLHGAMFEFIKAWYFCCIHFCINPVTVGQTIITILVGACMNLQDLLVQCFDRTQKINNIHTNEVTRHRSLGLFFGCCLHIVSFCLKFVFVDMQCFLFPLDLPW